MHGVYKYKDVCQHNSLYKHNGLCKYIGGFFPLYVPVTRWETKLLDLRFSLVKIVLLYIVINPKFYGPEDSVRVFLTFLGSSSSRRGIPRACALSITLATASITTSGL